MYVRFNNVNGRKINRENAYLHFCPCTTNGTKEVSTIPLYFTPQIMYVGIEFLPSTIYGPK